MEEEEEVDDPPAESAPVPQIKLGPNGEIMLDEQSLVRKLILTIGNICAPQLEWAGPENV